MKLVSQKSTIVLFMCGLFFVYLGMVIEFLFGAFLTGMVMQSLYINGVFLILIIVLFGGGVAFLRRSLLGKWCYRHDSIIFAIASIICLASAIQTLTGLQSGHPYLFLESTNPWLMYLLWRFVLPPMNPIIILVIGSMLLAMVWINLKYASRTTTRHTNTKKILDATSSFGKWRILANLTRIQVWLGSIFLLIINFIILGGPPLSPPPNILLYSPQTWFYLLLGVISVSLLNSAVFLINQVTDVDTDQLHSEKARLPISAGNISKYNAIFLVFLFISVGFVFSLFLGLTFILLMFGIFGFGILYSIRPFRIKSRPILDLFIIGLAFGLWAVLTAFTILVANPTISVNPELPLPLLIGPLLFYAGTHCIHTISDYQADKQAGINTTAVHLGPKKTAQLGILLIAIGFLSLYSGVGFYTHLFWYGLLKYKSIFLLIFCGLLFFALFQQFWTWQQAKKPDNSIVIQLQKSGRSVTYLLFFILVVYLLLNVFLFYPIYYPNYTFPWG